MAALMRCNVSRQFNLEKSMLRFFSVSSYNAFAVHKTQRSGVIAATDKQALTKQVNHYMDINFGISRELFQKLLTSIEKSDVVTDQDAATLLHICTIGPFDSPVEKRTEVADEIWNKLEQFGVTPSTKLYNLRLKVFIANRALFNPVDELQKMKELGLNPDRVTLTLLLEGFCQQGNITAANNVLEAMKSAGYLIGIGIFNSFITGHLKAGSPEEASNVLSLIKLRNLTPEADTYVRFAIHYAEEGDIESVMKYIHEAENSMVIFHQSNLLDIYRAMVRSGHASKAEPLLKFISEKGVFRSPTVQKTCQLASEGFTEAALKLYFAVPKLEDEKPQPNNGSFLIKAMILNGQSADDIMAIADKITEANVKALPHRNALLYAYKGDKTDLAVQILEKMKAKNFEIKVPYIIPAICNYRQANNKEDTFKVVRMLLEVNEEHFLDDKIENLIQFAYPAVQAFTSSRQDIVQQFQDFEKTWNFIFFVDDLKKGYDVALKNAAGKNLESSLFNWYNFQNLITPVRNSWESCIEVLDFLRHQGIKEIILMSLAVGIVRHSAIDNNWDVVDKVVTALQKKNLQLKRGIDKLPVYKDSPQQIKEKIDKLCQFASNESYSNEKYLTYQQLKALTAEELKEYQKKNPNLRLINVVLLEKALETNDIGNIKQILRELQALEITQTLPTLSKLVYKFSTLGDTESALHYFDKLKQVSGNSYSKMIPLNLGIELVKVGNIPGAISMIKAADETIFPNDVWAENRKMAALRAMLKFSQNTDAAFQLHREMLKTINLFDNSTSLQIHSSYILRICEEDNNTLLLDSLVKLNEEFHVFPCLDRVLVKFIKNQDVPMLKKVMDLGMSVYGSNNFHFKLGLSFIECGLPSKAATVFQTPGLKLTEKSLIYGCEYFLRLKKIDGLESFVKISKDLPVSQGIMLSYLIKGYIAVNDLTKATQVLDQYAESFISPSKESVAMLVKEYISRNLPIPEALRPYTTDAAETTQTAETSTSESDSSSSSEEDEKDKDKKKQDNPDQKLSTQPPPTKKTSTTNS